MARPLKVTEEMKQEIMRDFEKKLCNMTLFDGKGVYELPKYKIDDGGQPTKATVFFTRNAWEKQQALVREFSSEVGWHGVVKRSEKDPTVFIVNDILVFPQEVTGATVTPDQVKYAQWQASLPDEQFNNLRYHGHSHVNMGVTPSSTDNKYQQDILDRQNGAGYKPEAQQQLLEELGDTNFFIFMIWNKSGQVHARVFDMWDNVMYDEKEVQVLHEGSNELIDFIKAAKEIVVNKSYTYNKGYNYAENFRQYNQEAPKKPYEAPASKPSAMTQNKPTPAIPAQTEIKNFGPKKNYDFQYGGYRDADYD